MGEEFLEDNLWSDNPRRADTLIWWDGLAGQDRHMADFHRTSARITLPANGLLVFARDLGD